MVQDFVKNIIKNLEVDVSSKTRIGFLTWSNEAKVEFKLGLMTSVQDALQVNHTIVDDCFIYAFSMLGMMEMHDESALSMPLACLA